MEKKNKDPSQDPEDETIFLKLAALEEQQKELLQTLKEIQNIPKIEDIDEVKIVAGFPVPIANPDILMKMEIHLNGNKSDRKVLRQYLFKRGSTASKAHECIDRVLGGLMTSYCGHFLNFQGHRVKEGSFISDSNRIGMKKAMPLVQKIVQDVLYEIAEKNYKWYTFKDLLKGAVMWLSRRKDRLERMKNTLPTELPWQWSDEVLKLIPNQRNA